MLCGHEAQIDIDRLRRHVRCPAHGHEAFFLPAAGHPTTPHRAESVDGIGADHGLPRVRFRQFMRNALLAPRRVGLSERDNLLRHRCGNTMGLLGGG
jgi:hypothetical protein